MPQLYLASQSPRRQELLTQLGLSFERVTAEVVEQPGADETAQDYALRIAVAKARAGLALTPGTVPVLGADTDVVLDGQILGKPKDREDAIAMLFRLSGREHQVYSAVAVVLGQRMQTALSITRVRFGDITAQQADAYWSSGESAGKAGAYAIQGIAAAFVKEIQGSYSGVVGLPLYETVSLLQGFGIELFPNPQSRTPNSAR